MEYVSDIEPFRITFLRVLHSSSSSQVFLIKYDGIEYCLKIFHMKSDPGFTTTGRHLCRFRSETKAYEILQKHGISKRGHIPCFHGSFDQLDPARFSPHLDSFLHDERNPSAIMLEYLPNAQRLNCENYSDERMKKVVAGINDIHSAYIEHNDPYPRNILIVPGSPERLVWIDFDIAIIYHVENTISEMERAYLKEETEVVESLGHLLKEDQRQGLPPNTKFY